MKSPVTQSVRRHLDQELDSARALGEIARPPGGWINAVRRALGMTERQLAERLGVAQSNVHRLERSEANETIRLDTLRRAADALDCSLVYVLVPRRPLEEIVSERARALARSELAKIEQTMSLEAQDVSLPDSAVDERAAEIISRGGLWRGP